MKTLVFSDTHFGKYNKKRTNKLINIIKKYDKVIIVGDLFDCWFISFKDFINTPEYKDLFNILKSKDTVYIWGNHDSMEKENIKLAEIFSDYQTNVYETKIGDKNFHFEHGDMFFSKDRWEFFLSVPAFIRNPLSDFFHFIIYKLFPRSTVKNKIGVKMNNHIKEVQDPDKIYVVGHTHVPEIDLEAKFVNTGAIIRNFVYYVEIDEQGNAKLIKDSSR